MSCRQWWYWCDAYEARLRISNHLIVMWSYIIETLEALIRIKWLLGFQTVFNLNVRRWIIIETNNWHARSVYIALRIPIYWHFKHYLLNDWALILYLLNCWNGIIRRYKYWRVSSEIIDHNSHLILICHCDFIAGSGVFLVHSYDYTDLFGLRYSQMQVKLVLFNMSNIGNQEMDEFKFLCSSIIKMQSKL